MRLAVLQFGGFSSDEKITKHAQVVTQVLKENNIRTKKITFIHGLQCPLGCNQPPK